MSRDYWEERYQTRDMPWEKGAPSPGLVEFLEKEKQWPRGTVCVPGCGTGHDVRAWAAAGFAATGYDIAPSAIEIAIQKTREAGLQATFKRGDFLHDTAPEPFDWVFEHTLFCAIQPGERGAYVRALPRWLKPGGHYLAVYYFIPDTDGPPFGTDREEIIKRFGPDFELVKDWEPESYPNRRGLERMFLWRDKRNRE